MAITLDAPGLLRILGLQRGDVLLDGFVLEGAMGHHEGGVLLSWREAGGRSVVGLQVRRRDDGTKAWQRTPSLDIITHLPRDRDQERLLGALSALVERLRIEDREPGCLTFPPTPPGAPAPQRLELPPHRAPEAPSPFGFGRVFVLDLESDCGQRCSFCSTRAKWSPVGDFPPDVGATLKAGLREARSDGYHALRLSGLDPLHHPALLDALREAVACGYDHIHLYSPSTRYADSAFLDDLLEACGDVERTFHIPLYGPDAAAHDRVTGTPGSFDAVLAGVEALWAAGQGERIVWLSVLTRSNAPRWAETLERLGQRPGPVQIFLPFPSTRAADDAFFTQATTHTEALEALAAGEGPPRGLAEILPCVRYRHERDHGTPVLTQGPFHPVTALLGTLFEHADYRRLSDGPGGTPFTIPTRACPHTEVCALADLCPRGVYAAYGDLFGLDELQPVSTADLEALGFEL